MSGVALVTGVTGFIGSALAAHLAAGGWRVIGMTRRRGPGPPHVRACEAMHAHAASRISFLSGDFARPGCGLATHDVHELAATVDVVFHCAGDTAFLPADPVAFRRINVSGPAALLQLMAQGGRRIRWVHLSTAFICGTRTGVVLEDEDDVGQDFHNAYERTKLAGELTIRRAATRSGVELVALRPAIVIGSAGGTSGATPSARLLQFIRLIARAWRRAAGLGLRVRIESAPSAVLNLVPLEYVVQATAAIASHSGAIPQVCHLVADNPPTQQRLLDVLVRVLEIDGVSLVDGRAAPLRRPTLLERAVRILTRGYTDYLLQDVRFDDRNARRVLADCNMRPPQIDEALVRRWVATALHRSKTQRGLLNAGAEPGCAPLCASFTGSKR